MPQAGAWHRTCRGGRLCPPKSLPCVRGGGKTAGFDGGVVGMYRHAVIPQPLLRRPTFSVMPRPRKLPATLRSAYVRLSQSRCARLALLESHAIPRPAASGRSRPLRCSSSPKCKRLRWFAFWFYKAKRGAWGAGVFCLSMTASTRIERCGHHTVIFLQN